MRLFQKAALLLAATGLILIGGACVSPTSNSEVKTSSTIGVFLGTSTSGTAVVAAGTVAVNNAVLGTPSTTTFTISNTGNATLTLTAPVISGTDAGLFSVSTAPALTVAAGASTTFVVTFTPTEVASGRTATLTIANNSSNVPSFVFSVTADATAVPVPALSVSVASATLASGGTVDFGSVALGVPGPVTVTLSNIGTAPLTGVSAVVSGSTEFAITGTPTDTVAAGASTTVVLALTPVTTATGVRTGALAVTSVLGTFDASLTGTGVVNSKVYYVTQSAVPSATSYATYTTNAFTLKNGYTSSNNNFVYQASGNYYGKLANSFVTFPTKLSGDFSITAKVTNPTSGGNAGSGIGIGMTTGFASTDRYAFTVVNNVPGINMAYVSGATTVTNVATATLSSYTANTTYEITLKRVGATLYFGATTGTLATLATSACTDGTTVFGDADVYPCLSFARTGLVTVTDLVIKDASGNIVYDSAFGGTLGTYVPAALTVSTSSINLGVGSTVDVSAVANADGYDAAGAIGTVSAAVVDGTGSVTATVVNGSSGSTVTITGVTAGTATVNLTSDTSTGSKTKSIAVTVTGYPVNDSAYTFSSASFYPTPGATDAYTDGELAITFDTVPTLESGGLVKIFKKSDGSEVDSITFTGETQSVPTSATTAVTINVGTQLVRIDSTTKTVYITPHFGKLEYGTSYYVAFPSTSVSGTFGGATFDGLSSDKDVATWNFTTRAAPTLNASSITVSNATSNTTADFRSLGGALMYLAKNPLSATAVNISVAAGTYTELVQYRPSVANLAQTFTITGPSNTRGSDCIIQYVNGGGLNSSAQNMRASFYFAGANLVLKNLTLKNNGLRATVSQAEALYFDSKIGSTLAVSNCSIVSKQDTVNTTGRNWFFNCYIEGNVDFVWGTADAALFENCALYVAYDGTSGTATSPYSLIVSRTPGLLENLSYTSDSANSSTANMATFTGTVGKGYVLKDSTVTVQSPSVITLARDATAGKYYDQVAVINTVFGTDSTGTGVIGSTGSHYLWSYATVPTKLGDSTFVGFKGAGNSGLNLSALTNDISAYAASSIADQSTEYDTRDHILNRVVTVTAGTPSGYEASPLGTWDVTALATAFGAP